MKGTQIHGMLFRPCFTSQEDFKQGWKRSEFFAEKNFMEEYRKHIVAMQHTAECAKIYIAENWQKISSWKDLNVKITDNSGKTTEYFNYTEKIENQEKGSRKYKSRLIEEVFKRIEESDREKHNPVERLENVVLDFTDGDFSLTINGNDHLWIDDESVIVIADFIEKTLENGTSDN